MLKTVEVDQNTELLQQVCDILVAGGYFRARLNIEPFDKVREGFVAERGWFVDLGRDVLVNHG